MFHTYSTYGRGVDLLLNTYNYLDLTPFGRGEGWGGMPDLHGDEAQRDQEQQDGEGRQAPVVGEDAAGYAEQHPA